MQDIGTTHKVWICTQMSQLFPHTCIFARIACTDLLIDKAKPGVFLHHIHSMSLPLLPPGGLRHKYHEYTIAKPKVREYRETTKFRYFFHVTRPHLCLCVCLPPGGLQHRWPGRPLVRPHRLTCNQQGLSFKFMPCTPYYKAPGPFKCKFNKRSGFRY